MINIKIQGGLGVLRMDCNLVLPEEISITNIGEWKDRLVAVLRDSASINIDASDLSRVDTAAIQLLAVFTADMQGAGKTVNWQALSPELDRPARQLGLG